jgi:hypothetical protein
MLIRIKKPCYSVRFGRRVKPGDILYYPTVSDSAIRDGLVEIVEVLPMSENVPQQ